MFYHQTLLQRRGQLGIIWMEAVQASPYRICNRQVLQVNVIRTCSRILEGINARNENDGFSLYLSAHLMYGVVSIWRKQINILLAEAQEFKNRMRSDTAVLESIDLHYQPKLDQINIPDAVTRAGDEDPFFGSLKHFDETWDAFLRARIYPEIPSPVLPLSPDRHRETVSDSPTFLEPELRSPHTVASKADITMRELPFSTSPLMEVQVPGEMDIPAPDGQDVEMMAEKPEEEVVLTLQDLLPQAQTTSVTMPPPHEAQMSPVRGDKTPEKAVTAKVEGRPKGEKKRRKRKEKDLDQTQLEEPEPPRPKRPSSDEDLVLESPPVEVSPRRRRTPRRTLFVDTLKELPKAEIKHNIETAETTCRTFVCPQIGKDTVARMFKKPALEGLLRNPILRKLWERNCLIKENESVMEIEDRDADLPFPQKENGESVSPSAPHEASPRERQRAKRGESSLEEGSSQDEARMDQHAEDMPVDTEQVVIGTPSVETVREGSLSVSRTPQHSFLQMPAGQSPGMDDTSLSRPGTRAQSDRSREGSRSRRGSSLEPDNLSSVEEPAHDAPRSSSTLEVLREEMEEMPLSPPVMPILPEYDRSTPERKFVRSCEQEGTGRYTTFRAMCPPTQYNKYQAAKCFIALIDECSQRRLFVRQHRPYGDIYISTSPQTLPRPRT